MYNYKSFLPFIGRLFTYTFGFAYLLFYSKYLGPDQFGKFSAIMAGAELFSSLISLGSSGVVYRSTANSHSISFKLVAKITLFGLLLSTFFAAILYFVNYRFQWNSPGSLIIGFFLAYNSLLLAGMRGLNIWQLTVYDGGIRSLLYIFLLCFATIFLKTDYRTAIMVVIFGCLALSVLYTLFMRYRLPARGGADHIGIKETAWLTISSISTYTLKKSDVLVASIFLDFSHLASFKIALVLGEVCYQFSEAFYTRKIALYSTYRADLGRRSTSIEILCISAVTYMMTIILASALYYGGFITGAVLQIIPAIGVYYLLRIPFIPFEQIMIMINKSVPLAIVNIFSGILKLFIMSVIFRFFDHSLAWLFPLMAIILAVFLSQLLKLFKIKHYYQWIMGYELGK